MWPLLRGSRGLVTKGPYLFILVVLTGEPFAPREHWQRLETFLVVTAVGERDAADI